MSTLPQHQQPEEQADQWKVERVEKFSASQATKFMNCRASANLDVAIPNWVPPEIDPDADNAANRGTKMHAIMAQAAALSSKDMLMLGEAMQYIASVRRKSGRRFKVRIEQPVQALWLATKPWTTADLVLYTKDEIHVLDLKTGAIPVSAVENEQLMFYDLAYGYLAPQAKGVYNHIVQPWAGVQEMWFADAARLAQFMRETIAVESDILNKVTTFTPGDHCKFCPANPHGRGAKGRPFCPALMQIYYPQPEPDYDAIMELE